MDLDNHRLGVYSDFSHLDELSGILSRRPLAESANLSDFPYLSFWNALRREDGDPKKISTVDALACEIDLFRRELDEVPNNPSIVAFSSPSYSSPSWGFSFLTSALLVKPPMPTAAPVIAEGSSDASSISEASGPIFSSDSGAAPASALSGGEVSKDPTCSSLSSASLIPVLQPAKRRTIHNVA